MKLLFVAPYIVLKNHVGSHSTLHFWKPKQGLKKRKLREVYMVFMETWTLSFLLIGQ